MKLTPLAGSWLVAAGLIALPATLAAQKETENVNQTVPFPDNGSLKLNNFSGRVTISGTTGREVVIKAIRRAERDRLDHIKLDIRTEGSSVVIDANKRDRDWDDRKDNVVDTEFTIEVPSAAALDLHAFSSDLDVRGVTGNQKLHTFSGDITVRDARGALNVDTFSGEVDVDFANAGPTSDLRTHTFSGNITVRLGADAKGDVDFTSHSGDFDAEMPVSLHSSRRGRVSAALPAGSSGRRLSFDTFSGSVRIRK